VSILRDATTRRGKLPEPELARLVTVIVDADRADTVFAFIYAQAHIGRPGGGAVMMAPLAVATPFLMPPDVPDESGDLAGPR
jgi:nitrogen regulatory protein PII